MIIAIVTIINRPDPATPQHMTGGQPPALPDGQAAHWPSGAPDRLQKSRKAGKQGGCLPWAIGLVVLAMGYAIWQFPSFKAQAELGASYAARIGCSCRYVQGRDINSCETDFEPGMALISLVDDPEQQSVTGRAPLLASRTARYAGPSGCILLPPK